MKEAIVSAGPKVKIVDSPVPEPSDDQVLIKVVVSGSNPKDWKYPEWKSISSNQGDDIAGIVHKVGKNVTEFKPGDRVAAFHEMFAPGGSYAEYALAWQHTTFHIPKNTSFEAAAAIPLAVATAALGLYERLRLPQPWTPANEEIPLVVYGAASAVGSYVLQLARRSNIHPLICVAGSSQDHVEKLIDRSKGDTIVDYRDGADAVVEGIKKALGGRKLLHAYDATSEHGSYQAIGKVLAPGGVITTVLPVEGENALPEHVVYKLTYVADVHKGHKDFGFVYFRYIAKGLQDGWFKPQPQEVLGGLEAVEAGLANLKAGKAHGVKYVFRVSDEE
ncbi:Protein TOXD [Pleurostoma richardsiae]|uniref:Protein TOXD n=1 Tax=Pleurostoma richardsiae TaxID=41990 RepID=A0AA38RBR6_9PEZI|nr:Protein TOXD [Pleurostoma richardsiae]